MYLFDRLKSRRLLIFIALAALLILFVVPVRAADTRAGENVVIGDLAVGALSLENQSGSVIQGDLLIGAYQALLAGAIGQRVRGGLNRMELRGTVGGDMDVAISGDQQVSALQFSPAGTVPIPGVPPNLTIAESAQIGGMVAMIISLGVLAGAGMVISYIAFAQRRLI